MYATAPGAATPVAALPLPSVSLKTTPVMPDLAFRLYAAMTGVVPLNVTVVFGVIGAKLSGPYTVRTTSNGALTGKAG